MAKHLLATVTDTDDESVTVCTTHDASWQPCVLLTTRANMTFERGPAYLAPAAARELAQALISAAEQAEQAAAEQAAL